MIFLYYMFSIRIHISLIFLVSEILQFLKLPSLTVSVTVIVTLVKLIENEAMRAMKVNLDPTTAPC